MVRKIISATFECGMCLAIHDREPDAQACEARANESARFKVGDFFGADHHGWWEKDTSWALSQVCDDYFEAKDDAWERSAPGPFAPGVRAFLPIWRVVAIDIEPRTHRARIMAWCPRHANRQGSKALGYGEALAVTYSSNHVYPMAIPATLQPTLTTAEQSRFALLVASPPSWAATPLL